MLLPPFFYHNILRKTCSRRISGFFSVKCWTVTISFLLVLRISLPIFSFIHIKSLFLHFSTKGIVYYPVNMNVLRLS